MLLGLAVIGLLTFMAGAWLMRLQKRQTQRDPALRSLPAPTDLGDLLMRIVAYVCVGGGALVFLGAMIALAFAFLS